MLNKEQIYFQKDRVKMQTTQTHIKKEQGYISGGKKVKFI